MSGAESEAGDVGATAEDAKGGWPAAVSCLGHDDVEAHSGFGVGAGIGDDDAAVHVITFTKVLDDGALVFD